MITTYSGKTIEIGHTDAEGRLVLCDALWYAQLEKPKAIIDVATLTGCARAALGEDITAFLSNNDTLSNKIVKAAKDIGETFHRLPLHVHYKDVHDSKVADLLSCSIKPGPDTIHAALFLQEFVGGTPWAHMDIAAVATKDGEASGEGLHTLIKLIGGKLK